MTVLFRKTQKEVQANLGSDCYRGHGPTFVGQKFPVITDSTQKIFPKDGLKKSKASEIVRLIDQTGVENLVANLDYSVRVRSHPSCGKHFLKVPLNADWISGIDQSRAFFTKKSSDMRIALHERPIVSEIFEGDAGECDFYFNGQTTHHRVVNVIHNDMKMMARAELFVSIEAGID